MYFYPILVLSVLLLLSAFFSASETALTSVSLALVTEKAKQGNRRASLVLKLLNNKGALIITILTLSTFVNIFFTIYTTAFTVHYLGESYVAIVGVLTASLILILGEILPKTCAFNKPSSLALSVAPIIYLIIKLLGPITKLLMIINNVFFNLSNPHHSAVQRQDSLDNLRGAIDLLQASTANKTATAASQEKEMLHSLLDLNNLTVAEIMVHRKNVFCLDVDLPTQDLIKAVVQSTHNKIPLYQGSTDNIIGIVQAKEILKQYVKHGDNFKVKDSIRTAVYYPETTHAFDLLMYLQQAKEKMVIVVDEYGGFMGIVCTSDILEEIVGELRVSNINSIRPDPKGGYIINGDITIRDLNRKLKWNLPYDYATTIAGLILYETGRVPAVGNIFALHGYQLEVLEKKMQQIKRIRVSKIKHK